MTRIIRCFDPLHSTRVGQPGHCDILATRPFPDGPDLRIPGLFCGACGAIFNAQKVIEVEAARDQRKQAVRKFAEAFPGFSRDDLRHVFPDADDFLDKDRK